MWGGRDVSRDLDQMCRIEEDGERVGQLTLEPPQSCHGEPVVVVVVGICQLAWCWPVLE